MEMAKDMPYLQRRLIQSALGQKVEAEPVGNHRGRSQGAQQWAVTKWPASPARWGRPWA